VEVEEGSIIDLSNGKAEQKQKQNKLRETISTPKILPQWSRRHWLQLDSFLRRHRWFIKPQVHVGFRLGPMHSQCPVQTSVQGFGREPHEERSGNAAKYKKQGKQ